MWSRDTSGNSYNICNFLVEMLTYKQTIILTFGRNKFSKRTLQNLETRAHFWEKSRDQIDKMIAQLHLSKSIPM